MTTYRLGKLPPVHDERTLRLRRYLSATLPPPPPTTAYYDKVSTWPMYDNDKYGDCTCAAAGHMIQSWTANAGAEVTPPDASVVSFYEHFVGTPPPPDAGCDMLSVLKYWRSTGLDAHKVVAFASVDLTDVAQAKTAIAMLGGIYIGVALPDFAVTGDMLTVPWTVPPGGPVGTAAPDPANGHCIPAVGYDDTQLWVVTWGELKSMAWDFYNAYADEVYAVLSGDLLNPAGTAPDGLDLAALESDLSGL